MSKFFLALSMKSIIATCFLLANFSVYCRTLPADTTIKGITISFSYSPSIFPDSWQTSPISASGNPISSSEIQRSKSAILNALFKYPAKVLQKNLKAVYFLKSMNFFDVGYGGTNSSDALYLTNDGIEEGYTDSYLEQTFHHEFSSILFRNYPNFLDTIAWKKANVPEFDYNDPEAGVGAIRNNQSSQELDTALCKKGFLTQYAYSSLENDVNTLAQNLFKPEPNFWNFMEHYQKINKKVKLLIAFYNKIDSMFTEAYFRKFTQ